MRQWDAMLKMEKMLRDFPRNAETLMTLNHGEIRYVIPGDNQFDSGRDTVVGRVFSASPGNWEARMEV